MSERTHAEQGAPVPLRRNRPFAYFWIAQLLSNAGTQISELAIPLIAAIGLRPALVVLGIGCLSAIPWVAAAAAGGHLTQTD